MTNLFIDNASDKTRLFLVAMHPTDDFPFIGESQGIAAIAGYLNNKYDIQVDMFDQQIHSFVTIIDEIINKKPIIIGVSLKMFTFNQFEMFYDLLIANVLSVYTPIIITGNSLAHFSGENILTRFGNNLLIGVGEGELSLGDLFEYVNGFRSFHEIRNIAYSSNGHVVHSKFEYLNQEIIPIADRRLSKFYYEQGGEVYIEGSRGCAYCGCNICECRYFLGSISKTYKWRAKPISSIVSELKQLTSIGINYVTFSDEDFFGDDELAIDRTISLSLAIIEEKIDIKFRINSRIKSIYNSNDTIQRLNQRKHALTLLKEAGLIKIFLGLESGSQSQLSRYNKGFSLIDFSYAKYLLNDIAIDYELGFICFDPLMTFEELQENVKFINDNECILNISSVFKELRIQCGNKSYLKLLRRTEELNDVKLIDKLDFNAQLFPVILYLDGKVMSIVNLMREYDKETYKIYYLIRIITQYSLSNDDDPIKKTAYSTIASIKINDINLLKQLITTIDPYKCQEIIDKHKNIRMDIYNELKEKCRESSDNEKYTHLLNI